MKRGPAASPSSQIVTKRTAEDLLLWPSRSFTTSLATGTIPTHVKVLFSVSRECEVSLKWSGYSHCECHESQ